MLTRRRRQEIIEKTADSPTQAETVELAREVEYLEQQVASALGSVQRLAERAAEIAGYPETLREYGAPVTAYVVNMPDGEQLTLVNGQGIPVDLRDTTVTVGSVQVLNAVRGQIRLFLILDRRPRT